MAPAQVAFLPPSIVQELSQKHEMLDYCSKNLEMIYFAGGYLPQSMGDKIASRIRLVSQFGASELGMTANLLTRNRSWQDWKYVQFHPDTGIDFAHVEDSLYELHVKRDSAKEEQQPTFTIFSRRARFYAS